MAKSKFWFFAVEGEGPFPFDMLRYDTCWPAGSPDANLLTIRQGRRRILMCCARQPTTFGGGLCFPTVSRWESFGWIVVASEHKEKP